MKNAVLFLLALTLVGCPDPKTPSPNPIPVPDTDQCGAMCDHIGGMGCEEGKPVYNSDKPGPKDVPNETCEEWCKGQQDKGVYINPRCVALVKSCDEIEDARLKKCN